MEVPCRAGIAQALVETRDRAAPGLDVTVYTVGVRGNVTCQVLAGLA